MNIKSQYKIIVIGGGIAGCSTLYHLAQEGIVDCALLERDELTSGTTWHSAAQVTNFGTNQTMLGLKKHSINLYKKLAADETHPVGYNHGDGGLRLASQQWHMEGYKHFASMAKGMGVDFEIIDATECKKRHPLISTTGIIGALWDAEDGHIDPAQLCQALANGARKAGAEIHRQCEVKNISKNKNGWLIETNKKNIECEILINAAGYRCNEIGKMLGVVHPVVSMEHQYFITQEINEIKNCNHRIPLIRCPTDDFYQRQEKNGLLVGFYEQQCKTWGLEKIDPNFSNALCPNDLERVSETMEGAIARLPCLANAGIKTTINGPITYTPDGIPLVGKIPNLENAYCIIGLRAGLGEGGGHGWLLAQQIAHGEAQYDTWCLDPRRFTNHATIKYTAEKAIEDYQNEFRFHRPHEHRSAGRPAKTTALTKMLKEKGAKFTSINGWERATFFAPKNFKETFSFKFANWHEIVGAEIKNVVENVSLMEVSGFNQYIIKGRGAYEWLDKIMCTKVSRQKGRVGLHYFLNKQGNIKGEATLANISDEQIKYGSAAASEYHDWEWLHENEKPKTVEIKSQTNSCTVLVLAGPKSRQLLADVAPKTDWQNFKWMRVEKIKVGAVELLAMSVSFSGELAFELHVPNENLVFVYEQLIEKGKKHKLGHFGLYATESMRIEKGYRHWKSDLITEYNMEESSLEHFVDETKNFIGKGKTKNPTKKFKTLIIESQKAPAQPGDSILAGGKVVGTITSAAWGYRTNKNLAMGFINPEQANKNLEIEILGKKAKAKTTTPCQYDPNNKRVKA